jgi:hypothetical protein
MIVAMKFAKKDPRIRMKIAARIFGTYSTNLEMSSEAILRFSASNVVATAIRITSQ